GLYAVDLGGGDNGAVVAQFVNGKVDCVGGGMGTTLPFTKVSNVSFSHTGSEVTDSTLLSINGGCDSMVTECSFYGVSPSQVGNENGVFVSNGHSVRIAGNNYNHMQPGNGSCIVVIGSSRVVRVTDNRFNDERNAYVITAPH